MPVSGKNCHKSWGKANIKEEISSGGEIGEHGYFPYNSDKCKYREKLMYPNWQNSMTTLLKD